jgi:hypothetical protein
MVPPQWYTEKTLLVTRVITWIHQYDCWYLRCSEAARSAMDIMEASAVGGQRW